jgi:hypothetical protein
MITVIMSGRAFALKGAGFWEDIIFCYQFISPPSLTEAKALAEPKFLCSRIGAPVVWRGFRERKVFGKMAMDFRALEGLRNGLKEEGSATEEVAR